MKYAVTAILFLAASCAAEPPKDPADLQGV
jgi:hypothetical protein